MYNSRFVFTMPMLNTILSTKSSFYSIHISRHLIAIKYFKKQLKDVKWISKDFLAHRGHKRIVKFLYVTWKLKSRWRIQINPFQKRRNILLNLGTRGSKSLTLSENLLRGRTLPRVLSVDVILVLDMEEKITLLDMLQLQSTRSALNLCKSKES